MDRNEALELMAWIDTTATVLKLSNRLLQQARAEGLITIEEQQERHDKVKALLKGTPQEE